MNNISYLIYLIHISQVLRLDELPTDVCCLRDSLLFLVMAHIFDLSSYFSTCYSLLLTHI